jgi:hypothetical protein
LLVLAGVGRSGSTLLDRLIGQLPGHVSVGELSEALWERDLQWDWPCGCGKRFTDCEFWSAVGQRAFGGWDTLDPAEIADLQRAVDKTPQTPMLLAPSLVPGFKPKLDRYLDALTRVYAAVQHVTGAQVIVDSSKAPSLPYALRHADSIDLTVAHIVRDPRGVAYSWTKRKQNLGDRSDRVPEYMPTWTPRRAARRWVTVNAMIAALPRLGVPVVRVRYEDLVRNPGAEVARVADALGESVVADDLPFIRPGEVELQPAHISYGNPNRFDAGWVPLQLDEAWRTALPHSARRTVERITAPLRGIYGYRK